MIRKWLKLNSCFIELLKNSAASKNLDKKWTFDIPSRHRSTSGFSDDKNENSPSSHSVPAGSISSVTGPFSLGSPQSEYLNQGDAKELFQCAIVESPSKTELFEVRGPGNSAYLIEVKSKDLETVKKDLDRLKGDFFHYDKSILDLFEIKCVLAAESTIDSGKERMRLAKVHAICCGCDEVYVVTGTEKVLFVNSVEDAMRSKKILEKLGYKVTEIMYKFHPKETIDVENRYRGLCYQFLGAAERLPKVLSVTHNLEELPPLD